MSNIYILLIKYFFMEKERKNNLIANLIMLLILFLGFCLVYFISNELSTNLLNKFDSYLIYKLVIGVLVVFFIAYILFEPLSYFELINRKVYFTICLMILFFVSGSIWIEHNYGEKSELKLALFDSNDRSKVIGNITCADSSGSLVVGNFAFCEVQPRGEILEGNVIYSFKNGSAGGEDFSDLNFIIPKNAFYIKFLINISLEQNISRNLEVGYRYQFYTEEEQKSREERYVYYYLILLGVILFSVPSMMNNFYFMSEKPKNLFRGNLRIIYKK